MDGRQGADRIGFFEPGPDQKQKSGLLLGAVHLVRPGNRGKFRTKSDRGREGGLPKSGRPNNKL